MVIYIKGTLQSLEYSDLMIAFKKIAKYMINIETNQDIFTETFEKNPTPTLGFNKYSANNILYEATNVTHGTILIYINKINAYDIFSYNTDIINMLQTCMNQLGYTHIQSSLGSSPYTLHIHNDLSSRSIGISNNKVGKKFIWNVNIISKSYNKPMLHIPGYTSKQFTKPYLARALTTIIYDTCDLFNMPLKQLNYPSIHQYSLFHRGKLCEENIIVHNKFGIEPNFIKAFTNFSVTYESKPIKITTAIAYDSLEIRRVHPTKDWLEAIKEPYDYEKQEQEELNPDLRLEGKPNFQNDICFISKVPLSYMAIASFIRNKETQQKFCILISPSMEYAAIYNDTVYNYNEILDQNGFEVINECYVSYPRSAIDVIDMLPDTINPLKKKILKAIEKYGIYCHETYGSQKEFITLDLEEHEIYIGIKNFSDIDMLKYVKSNAILYHIIDH